MNRLASQASHGFAMIVSILMLAVIIITAALTSVFFVTGQLAQGTSLETYQVTKSLAESCVEVAMLKYIQSPAYAGNETITIGADTCSIKTLTGSSPKIITTESIVRGYVYRLRVEVTGNNPPTITKWQRVASF